MKMEGRWGIVILGVIAAIGISGIIEALPHASESVSDLAIDTAILALVIAVCLVLNRLFGKRSRAE
jgi:flagellar biogenesis protein FliO